jgi:hypothetical protein
MRLGRLYHSRAPLVTSAKGGITGMFFVFPELIKKTLQYDIATVVSFPTWILANGYLYAWIFTNMISVVNTKPCNL